MSGFAVGVLSVKTCQKYSFEKECIKIKTCAHTFAKCNKYTTLYSTTWYVQFKKIGIINFYMFQ